MKYTYEIRQNVDYYKIIYFVVLEMIYNIICDTGPQNQSNK